MGRKQKGFVKVRDDNVLTARRRKAGPHMVKTRNLRDEACDYCGSKTCREYECIGEDDDVGFGY